MNSVEKYLADNYENALEDLKAFCRIASVSTDPAFGDDIREAAEFVANRLKKAGFASVEVWDTGGHPSSFTAITMCNRPIRSTSG
jgi:acetylornithine deacetylase/succinyl-diaminopimelate desuccinylase-like protein